MGEEEKKAIELLKQEPDFSLNYYNRENAIDIVLNLIEKQQKEIEDLNEKIIELKEKEIIKKSSIPTQEKFEDYYNYISKDKIKELIDIFNNTHENYVELPTGKLIDRSSCDYLIKYLQQILDERN